MRCDATQRNPITMLCDGNAMRDNTSLFVNSKNAFEVKIIQKITQYSNRNGITFECLFTNLLGKLITELFK